MPEIPFPLPAVLTADLIRTALTEDLGSAGDLTSLATVPADRRARAVLNSREAGIVSGAEMAARVFREVDPGTEIDFHLRDGERVGPGDAILTVLGPARSLLTAERVALNLIGHMSGIATATAALVAKIEGTPARIACTRKTLPGLRAIQKHAVRCGGGMNHRFALADAVMIKDNHIVAAGGVVPALRAAKAAIGHTVKIEIEVDTLAQLDEVLTEGADIVLLDNMTPDLLAEAVRRTRGRALLEASGGVTLTGVRAIAETGVDIISSGALTHSVSNLDIGLELELQS